MQNGFLVRLMGINKEAKKEEFLKAYWTTDGSETLKTFHFMKENEILLTVPVEYEKADKWDGEEFYITDITFNFGGSEALACINVWVEL